MPVLVCDKMFKMKKRRIIFIVSQYLLIPFFVEGSNINSGLVLENPIRANNIQELLSAIIEIVIYIGMPVIAFFIILAGFRFVTARGDKGKIASARDALLNAIIGSAIVLGAFGIAKGLEQTISNLSVNFIELFNLFV